MTECMQNKVSDYSLCCKLELFKCFNDFSILFLSVKKNQTNTKTKRKIILMGNTSVFQLSKIFFRISGNNFYYFLKSLLEILKKIDEEVLGRTLNCG